MMHFPHCPLSAAIDFGFGETASLDRGETGQQLSLTESSNCPEGTVWNGQYCEGTLWFLGSYIRPALLLPFQSRTPTAGLALRASINANVLRVVAEIAYAHPDTV